MDIKENALKLEAQGDLVVQKIESQLIEMLTTQEDPIAFAVGKKIVEDEVSQNWIDLKKNPELASMLTDLKSTLVSVLWDSAISDRINKIYDENGLWITTIENAPSGKAITEKNWIWDILGWYLLSLGLHHDNVDKVLSTSYSDIKSLLDVTNASWGTKWALKRYYDALGGGWWSGSWWAWAGVDKDWDIEGFSQDLIVNLDKNSFDTTDIAITGSIDWFQWLSENMKKKVRIDWYISDWSKKSWRPSFVVLVKNDWTFAAQIDPYDKAIESDFMVEFDIKTYDNEISDDSNDWISIAFNPKDNLLRATCSNKKAQNGLISVELDTQYEKSKLSFYRKIGDTYELLSSSISWDKAEVNIPKDASEIYIVAGELQWSDDPKNYITSKISGISHAEIVVQQYATITFPNPPIITDKTQTFRWKGPKNTLIKWTSTLFLDWGGKGNAQGYSIPVNENWIREHNIAFTDKEFENWKNLTFKIWREIEEKISGKGRSRKYINRDQEKSFKFEEVWKSWSLKRKSPSPIDIITWPNQVFAWEVIKWREVFLEYWNVLESSWDLDKNDKLYWVKSAFVSDGKWECDLSSYADGSLHVRPIVKAMWTKPEIKWNIRSFECKLKTMRIHIAEPASSRVRVEDMPASGTAGNNSRWWRIEILNAAGAVIHTENNISTNGTWVWNRTVNMRGVPTAPDHVMRVTFGADTEDFPIDYEAPAVATGTIYLTSPNSNEISGNSMNINGTFSPNQAWWTISIISNSNARRAMRRLLGLPAQGQVVPWHELIWVATNDQWIINQWMALRDLPIGENYILQIDFPGPPPWTHSHHFTYRGPNTPDWWENPDANASRVSRGIPEWMKSAGTRLWATLLPALGTFFLGRGTDNDNNNWNNNWNNPPAWNERTNTWEILEGNFAIWAPAEKSTIIWNVTKFTGTCNPWASVTVNYRGGKKQEVIKTGPTTWEFDVAGLKPGKRTFTFTENVDGRWRNLTRKRTIFVPKPEKNAATASTDNTTPATNTTADTTAATTNTATADGYTRPEFKAWWNPLGYPKRVWHYTNNLSELTPVKWMTNAGNKLVDVVSNPSSRAPVKNLEEITNKTKKGIWDVLSFNRLDPKGR